MPKPQSSVPLGPVTKQQLKEQYRTDHKERWRRYRNGEIWPVAIARIIVTPPSVDMKSAMTQDEDHEIAANIERFYAYANWEFDPTMQYPPGALDNFRSEWTLNAQGIYYHDECTPRLVTMDRKVWIPTLEGIDWEDSTESPRRKRARDFAEHNANNETWSNGKSEYAWEADAWADLFREMRSDPVLAMDKRQYTKDMPLTHPALYTLTGQTEVVQFIPDATFGFNTFSEYETDLSICAEELRRSRLEKLLLHPKCGLLADAKWGETDLVFPFAVYEAKGWSGDCRKARHQACQAAATYLDMLENLVHMPGPVESPKPYQKPYSHRYQGFALTSFGAYWHLLVGYRRPRAKDEHSGESGMSDTVYIFQKVWSGRVIDERTAWELCTLIDQIHLWAVTEFRAFVLEHLRLWHEFCEENYLLDWDGVYDRGPQYKKRREVSEDEELTLPSWTKRLNDTARGKIQASAKESLAEATAEHRLRRGKGKRLQPANGADECPKRDLRWKCVWDDCSLTEPIFDSGETYLNHCKDVHGPNTFDMFKLKRSVARVEERKGPTTFCPTTCQVLEHMMEPTRPQKRRRTRDVVEI